MSKYWNERLRALSPYVPGEQPKNQVIKLNTNENPYPPSPLVIEAIQQAGGEKLRLYPDPESLELREAIAAAYHVGPGQVFAGNGSDEVLAFVFAAFFEGRKPNLVSVHTEPASAFQDAGTSPGFPVLFPDITYSFYPVYAGLWEVPFRAVPLGKDFSVNTGDYLVPAGGVTIANPNAPTGMALESGELLRIAEYQGKADRVVVVDEAYGAFAFNTPPSRGTGDTNKTGETGISGNPIYGGTSVVPYIQGHPNLLSVHTLSKMGALAGLRVGFAIGQEELIEGLCRVRDSFNSYPVDRLAQAGAAAALRDTAYYHETIRRIIATRERVSSALKALGFLVLPSQANFVFARYPGKSGAEVFAGLRKQGILVRHFNKSRISDFLRITIGTDSQMDRFLEVCEELI
ncbi:MAG: aminotransferase class I/II-fold pyridoxal phosphate-dependent enzyme [Treponema sp.]|jgi:histidinol-phosphate aminotransferase|nr:aminotransferase class I/II-fold pyridoxal phosphate-dependent enzyme [Treponema sp.]